MARSSDMERMRGVRKFLKGWVLAGHPEGKLPMTTVDDGEAWTALPLAICVGSI